jgi:hypothetical protein
MIAANLVYGHRRPSVVAIEVAIIDELEADTA